ncbi:MAG: hypothetical protein U0165_12835 [Polyangiaceae bacterium]
MMTSRRWTLSAASLALVLVGGALGCSDVEHSSASNVAGASGSSGTAGEAGSSGSAGSGGTSGASGSSGNGGTAGNSGASGSSGSAGGGDCAIGDSVAVELGSDGGVISLCGVSLEVPSGAVSSTQSCELRVVAAPGDPPYGFQFGLAVVEVCPSLQLTSPVTLSLALPASSTGHVSMLALWDDSTPGWIAPETCPTQGAVTLSVMKTGVTTLLVDPETYPSSLSGVGSGSGTMTLNGQSYSLDVDPTGSATYEPGSATSRSYSIVLEGSTGVFQHLSFKLGAVDGQPPQLLELGWFDNDQPSEYWSWLQPIDGDPTSATISQDSSGAVSGSFEVPAHSASASAPISVTFSVQAEKYRVPPDSVCGE